MQSDRDPNAENLRAEYGALASYVTASCLAHTRGPRGKGSRIRLIKITGIILVAIRAPKAARGQEYYLGGPLTAPLCETGVS